MTEPGDGEIGVPPIRLILDASAICAFGAHETVGEIIGEFDDEGELFAVTSASLAEALARGADAHLVDVLRTNDNCVVVESTADWRSLGRFMDLTRPGPDRLHELADSDLTMLAVRTDAYILTDRPERYTAIVDSVTTIQLEKPWS
ncbi:hypothetical protein [Catellatospora citrea]|uniref:PIN domain-containing protein n=1 Tax=Catellatospora citrea TaxID=53366 RepID=A0A8J3K376_9ACTN|nr:hypothetical protein [Catellatospora citrea]RKE12983.1 hypothetical protein C8E86_7928 [Catellatospora citrea]GIF95777.1 hypothetical protein Cci01nite_08710 [Catellatospora citrea]